MKLVTTCVLYGSFFSSILLWMMSKHPLFPFNYKSRSWCLNWLLTTTADYYGEYIAFMFMVYMVRKKVDIHVLVVGVLNALIGSPVALLYVVRLTKTFNPFYFDIVSVIILSVLSLSIAGKIKF